MPILIVYLLVFFATLLWALRTSWRSSVRLAKEQRPEPQQEQRPEPQQFSRALYFFERRIGRAIFVALFWPVFLGQLVVARTWNGFFRWLWKRSV